MDPNPTREPLGGGYNCSVEFQYAADGTLLQAYVFDHYYGRKLLTVTRITDDEAGIVRHIPIGLKTEFLEAVMQRVMG